MLYTTAVYGPQVSIGGVSFNTGPDANGVEWIISDESGWYSTAGVKTTRAEKSSALGVVRMLEYKGGRSIAFNGTIGAPTQYLLRRSIDTLLGIAGAPDSLIPLTVTDESGVAYTAYVCIDGQTVTKAQSALSQVFTLQLFAPDPRRFATAHTYTLRLSSIGAGGVKYAVSYPVSYGSSTNLSFATVANAGTAYADLLFTLNGPLTTPTILCATTGDYLTYNGTITAGNSVTIDTAAGSVLYNGVTNYRALLTANNWFTIPAASSIGVTLSTLSSSDTGTVTVSASDSFY